MRARRLHDAVIVLVLFAASALWGTLYWNRSFRAGRQPLFYQSYFEPAVMIACGHGFVRAEPPVPAIAEFLLLRRDALSCDEIPTGAHLTDRAMYQQAWRYLIVTVGAAWRVLGISWSGLGPLFGALFGATIAAAYGIFRTGMGRGVAAACAVALAMSSIHLQNLPHLRDYSKAPFTMLLVLLLFVLVSGRGGWRRVLTLSALYGIVVGVGYGFRSDFLVDIPLFAVAVFGFLEGGLLRNLPMKATAVLVCLAAVIGAGWPVVSVVQERGGCQWHATLLGLTDGPSDALMVTHAPYNFGHEFFDEYAYAVATAYAGRTQPRPHHIEYCSHEYDVVTGRYASEIARTFPGDVVTRTLASVIQVLQLPFRWFDQPLPGWAGPVYRLRLVVLKPLRGFGVVFVAATLLALASVSPRLGLFGVFFVLYVGGYPMLQFDVRHYFHLEFMTWWAIGFLVHQAVVHYGASAGAGVRATLPQIRARYEWRRGIRTLAAAAAGVLGALWIARGYQQVSATRLFQRYADAPKQKIDVGTYAAGTLHRVLLGHDPRADPYPADLLEVDFNAARCGANTSVTFLYDRPYDAFGHAVVLDARAAGNEPTRVFEPVYAGFAGLRFDHAAAECMKGVFRVAAPAQFDLLLGATLPPSWRRHAMFQQLAPWQWRR